MYYLYSHQINGLTSGGHGSVANAALYLPYCVAGGMIDHAESMTDHGRCEAPGKFSELFLILSIRSN